MIAGISTLRCSLIGSKAPGRGAPGTGAPADPSGDRGGGGSAADLHGGSPGAVGGCHGDRLPGVGVRDEYADDSQR